MSPLGARPELRQAQAADVPALAALYAHCAHRLGPQVYSAAQVRAWASFGRDTPAFRDYILGATTWLAEDARGALGFCGVATSGEVHSLYVRPDTTRQGLGSLLLAHALEHAQAQGITVFRAWATPFSLAVFRRASFALGRTVREHWQGVEFERYRMRRD